MRPLLVMILMVSFEMPVNAQQVADPNYHPPIPKPSYPSGKGPRVAIDEAHHNFHTATGRYQPMADLLRRDGYRVTASSQPFSQGALKDVDILVIANALNERNKEDWSLPTPSAFTTDEIAAVRSWVGQGGCLFLIADHMPFPGAAGDLASAFGVKFSNGYAMPGKRERGKPDLFTKSAGLPDSPLLRSPPPAEPVTQVATFGGSAFKIPAGATPVLVFGPNSISHETRKAPGISTDAPQTPIEGWCQGAVLEFGKGRVALFGEAAMFSAQLAGAQRQPMGMNHPDAKQNYQLLLNIFLWLSRAK